MRARQLVPGILMACLTGGLFGQPASLSSPAGQVKIAVEVKDSSPKHPGERRLYWSVTYRGRPVLVESTLALQFKDMPPLEKNLVIKKSAVRATHETWQRVWGKRKNVVDASNELQLDLEESPTETGERDGYPFSRAA